MPAPVPAPVTTRRAVCGGLALAPLLLHPLPVRAGLDFNAAGIPWQKPSAGFVQARTYTKPVFMLVYADWCPACKTYSRLFSRPDVARALSGFVPVLADADHDRIERQYRPDGGYIPRSMVLTHEGELVEQLTGPYESRYFLPPKDPDYLIDFLARGLAFAGPEQIPLAQPSRKAAPLGDGPGPSLTRAGDPAAPAPDGPRRMRVPGQASVPAADSAPAAGPAPVAVPAEEEGLFRRLIDLFSS